MKRVVIGCIFKGKSLGGDEEIFIKLSKKKNVEMIFLDFLRDLDKKELKEKIKKCDIIYNNSAEDFSLEFEKTIEELGKKVIDTTKSHYYDEDKWMFYLKCKEHKIPAPETILLSEDLNILKKEIKNFNKFPLVLKRVEGTCGEFVERVKTISEVVKIVKKWRKNNSLTPIIAQEFINSPSYRVTVIGKEIIQTALKINKGWKATGVYAKKIFRFDIDKNLKKIVEKIIKISKLKICGIDFLKRGEEWLALEINSAPGFDFFESEREKIISKVIDLLKKEVSP
jgi:glutathione synthase/RimK-type ligase-like ATP-grasp enzyme